MTCIQCATPLPESSRFCPSCGTVISHPGLESDDDDRAASAAELLRLLREDTAGVYEISGEIGRGGMAYVYLATESSLGRRVAIKVLPPDLTFGTGMVERFKREARTSATLDHPNIIPVFRVSTGGKLFWYSMKYLDGQSLERLLFERGKLPIADTLRIMEQIADALDFAHERGVIHRDVKPANILLDMRQRAVITDFGIAKALTGGTLTAAGAILGTPQYMAPEQWSSKPLTGAADQYACAVMVYQMLIGRLPFTGQTMVELMQSHVSDRPDLEAIYADFGHDVTGVMATALAKSPEWRHPSIGAFMEALRSAAALPKRSLPLPSWDEAEPSSISTAPAPPAVLEGAPSAAPPVPPPALPEPRLPVVAASTPVGSIPQAGDSGAPPPVTDPPPVEHAQLASATRSLPVGALSPGPAAEPPTGRTAAPAAPPRKRAPHPKGPSVTLVPASSGWLTRTAAAALALVLLAGGAYVAYPILHKFRASAAPVAAWSSLPAVAPGQPSGGEEHSCFATTGGGVFCWGSNALGQLGDEQLTTASGPRMLASPVRFQSVDAGSFHTCAVSDAGIVYCWGQNTRGQATGTAAGRSCGTPGTCEPRPAVVAGVGVSVALAAGQEHTCALESDGSAVCWGSNYRGQLGNGSDAGSRGVVRVGGRTQFAAIAAGAYHTCGLTDSGALYCWGWNESGQLGTASRPEHCGPTPQARVRCNRQPVPVDSRLPFTRVTAGAQHSCALTRDGSAYCWGYNGSGQLGTANTQNTFAPALVAAPGIRFRAIAAGTAFSCGIAMDDAVWCWGDNRKQQLGSFTGEASPVPVALAGGHRFSSIGLGGAHACGITTDGSGVFCWGDGRRGQLGTANPTSQTTPVAVPGDQPAGR